MVPYTLTVSLGGRALDEDVIKRISHLEFAESIDELDLLVLRISVPMGDDSGDLMALARPGVTWTLSIETDAGTLKAEGDVVEASCGHAGGSWSVTLHGIDGLHRLRGGRSPSLWSGDWKDAVSQIARRHGLSGSPEGVDGSPKFTLQADEDDARFLKRIAGALNYSVRVRGKTLSFGRRDVAKGRAVTLAHDDVQDFTMTASLVDTVSKVTVIGHDLENDKEVKAEADKAKLKRLSKGKTGPELASAFGERVKLLHNAACKEPSLAQALATGAMQAAAETLVRATLRLDGRPDIIPGNLVSVSGAPWPAAGPFLVREARHAITARHYRTELVLLSDSMQDGP